MVLLTIATEWYVFPILGIVCLAVGWAIGSNNPLPGVKKKLIVQAQAGIGKL